MADAKVGHLYRHYKNKTVYEIIAIHTETDEKLVLYTEYHTDGNLPKVWARPISMFEEKISVNDTLEHIPEYWDEK